MKNVFVLFSVFVLSCSLFAQPVFKKQISFLDFNVRNPSFIETGDYGFYPYWFGSANALLFEGYKDPVHPQIFTLKYDLENDSFYTPTQITFSKGSCINPCGVFAPIGNISEMDRVIWQTNENGNWDIAYGELFGDTLRNVRFIAGDSLFDEINPKSVVQDGGFGFDFGITYEKDGSVYLYYEVDTLKVSEKIFDASGIDSYEYSRASGVLSVGYEGKNYFGIITAVKKFQNNDSRAVYKIKSSSTSNWSDEKFIYDSATTTTATKAIQGWGQYMVSFETIIEGKRTLKYFPYSADLGRPESAENISDSSYETFNFSFKPIMIVGKTLAKSFYGFGQNIYQVKKEEKNFLHPSYYSVFTYPYNDSLIEIKVSEPKITTANVGINYYLKAYSVWEDSSDKGTIQLFGSSGEYPVGGIENETTPQDFTLYQNYPNPFNPETVISFQLSVSSKVSLKVFDVLGREVATLVNEEKPAGEHEVLFNPQLTTNHQLLSSGVLFYQLKVGNRLQTKSMLLLK